MPSDTVGAALLAARRRLAATSATAALDARLLLQAAAQVTHEDIIATPDAVLLSDKSALFESYVTRRLAHEPVSRILGHRDFYGRRFSVTSAVLDPRPDTETLIDAALLLIPPGARLLDLGTGSGAIAVTLLAERTLATGVATDISEDALAVACSNAEAHGVLPRLELVQGDWFEPVTGGFDVILSNPPYVPAGDVAELAPDVREFDPLPALAGGADGLDPYRAIAAGAAGHLNSGGLILLEIGAGQEEAVAGLFAGQGLRNVGRFRDLAGHVRCLHLVRG